MSDGNVGVLDLVIGYIFEINNPFNCFIVLFLGSRELYASISGGVNHMEYLDMGVGSIEAFLSPHCGLVAWRVHPWKFKFNGFVSEVHVFDIYRIFVIFRH